MKKTFLSLLAVAAMASCTETNVEQITDGAGGGTTWTPVKVAASVNQSGTEALTRTPYEGVIAEDNPFTARVLAYEELTGAAIDWANPGRAVKNADITFTGGGYYGYDEPYYYPASGQVYVMGFYPADRWINDGTDVSFDGSDDVMLAQKITTNKALADQGTYPRLQFRHRLTALVIKVKGLEERWGKITGVELIAAGYNKTEKPKTVMHYDKATDGVTFDNVLGTNVLGTGSGNVPTDFINDDGIQVKRGTSGINVFGYVWSEAKQRNVFTNEKLVPGTLAIGMKPDSITKVGYVIAPPLDEPGDVTDPALEDKQFYFFRFYTEQRPAGIEVKVPRLMQNDNTTPFTYSAAAGMNPIGLPGTAGYAFDLVFSFGGSEFDIDVNGLTTAVEWGMGGQTDMDVEDNPADNTRGLTVTGKIADYTAGQTKTY